jgi:MFS family permease
MGELIAFRALQGIGAGRLLPLSQAAIADLFSPRERGRYQGLVGAMRGTASIVGPLAGGSLTDSISWRWIFLVNLPLGILALVVVMRTLRRGGRVREHRIDWVPCHLAFSAESTTLPACIPHEAAQEPEVQG